MNAVEVEALVRSLFINPEWKWDANFKHIVVGTSGKKKVTVFAHDVEFEEGIKKPTQVKGDFTILLTYLRENVPADIIDLSSWV